MSVFVVEIIGVYEADMFGIFSTLERANEAIAAEIAKSTRMLHVQDFAISEITVDEALVKP